MSDTHDTHDTHDIAEIESELESILATDKKAWVRMAELMEIVDREKLWKPGFKSFTQWVNDLAEKNKVHVSLIWERKKAGRFYAKYSKHASLRGEQVPDLQSTNLSSQNLSYIEKIAGGDMDVAGNLIRSVQDGVIPKEQLKAAWKLKRAAAERRGEKISPANGYDRKKRENASYESLVGPAADTEGVAQGEKRVTADQILVALTTSQHSWYPNKREERRFDAKSVFMVIPEFPVKTGASRHARRIDAVAISNYQCEHDDVRLVGVEIKVDKHDLLGDHKALEYKDFVDMMYFAVPEHLVDDAKSVLPSGWGVLSYAQSDQVGLAMGDYPVRIEVEASESLGVMRSEALTTAILKIS